MRYGASFALAALVVACASVPSHRGPCDRTYVVSGAFPDNQRAALERANARWNELGVEHFCFASGEATASNVYRIRYDSDEWRRLSAEFGGQNVIGVYRSGPDTIGIIDDLSDRLFEITALHEIGHARGLAHVTTAGAVMHSHLNDGTARDLTQADLTECRRVGACPSGAPSRRAASNVCILHASFDYPEYPESL